MLAWCRAYFIGLHAHLYDVALFHSLIQNLDCWLNTTKKSFSGHHTLFLVSSGVWAQYYAKYRSEAMTSVLSLQKLDHPPHLPRLHVPQIEFKEHQHWKVFHLICQWTCDGGQHFHSLFALPAEVSEQGPLLQGKLALHVPSVGLVGRLLWVDGKLQPPLLRQTRWQHVTLLNLNVEEM